MSGSSPSSSEPIIFVHRGCQPFFHAVARQAIRMNPRADVWNIGDVRAREVPGLRFEKLSRYESEMRQLEEVYVHYSPNPVDFELFCIQRWFAVWGLMERLDVRQAWVLDSDVLVYSELMGLDAFKTLGTGFTINGASPHAMFIRSRDALRTFCDDTIAAYRDGHMSDVAMRLGGEVKGISDMAFFQYVSRLHPGLMGNNAEIVDGAMFDNNFGSDQGCEMENGRKRLTWIDGAPHATLRGSGELVRLHGLHFQGGLKPAILEFMAEHGPERRSLLTLLEGTMCRVMRSRRRKRLEKIIGSVDSLPAKAA